MCDASYQFLFFLTIGTGLAQNSSKSLALFQSSLNHKKTRSSQNMFSLHEINRPDWGRRALDGSTGSKICSPAGNAHEGKRTNL